jgi:hypothetical protein
MCRPATLFPILLAASCLVLGPGRAAAQVRLDLLAATPVGSWQQRELTMIRKDKEGTEKERRILGIKTSRLEDESRGGEAYMWVELELQATRIDKKGKSTQEPPVVARMLIRRWFFDLDALNATNNLLSVAQEVIVQVADEPPVRYMGKGLQKVDELLGPKNKYRWVDAGHESVTVEAGTFEARHVKASADVEGKILLRKVKTQNEGDFWFSTQVPFGLVRSQLQQVVGEKTDLFSAELKAYDTSGAATKISGQPKDDRGQSRLVKIFGE